MKVKLVRDEVIPMRQMSSGSIYEIVSSQYEFNVGKLIQKNNVNSLNYVFILGENNGWSPPYPSNIMVREVDGNSFIEINR